MFIQLLSYIVVLVGLIGFWMSYNGVRGSLWVALPAQVLWFIFGWLSGFPIFMISAIIYGAIYARRAVLKHSDEKLNPFQFTKLPVKIEAIQILDIDNVDQEMHLGARGQGVMKEAPFWFKDALRTNHMWVMEDKEHATFFLLIETLEGDMRANIGDWIIRGVNGELYPCKPDIFDKSYA